MKLILCLVILTFYITTSYSSIYDNKIKKDVFSFLKRSYDDTKFDKSNEDDHQKEKVTTPNLYQKVMKMKEKSKNEYLAKEKSERDHETRIDDTKNVGKERYQLDPVLNNIKRKNFRKRGSSSSSSSDDVSSSSRELKDWKEEYKESWLKKKFEAVNTTDKRGDVVNMVAARPWGVSCGDPNQHDMPWGTCMLPMECDSEYRIYRGDSFCGHTEFVCCSLQYNNYDLYQGMDVSFAGSGFSTDSDDTSKSNSRSRRRKKKRKKERKRKKDRLRRKRKIKKKIRKIITEIRKILNKSYRNGTAARKKKTKQLKKFIKDLKKRYKKDRESIKDIHEIESIKIDVALHKKLTQIKDLNREFMLNSTFRDIIESGKTNKQGARMLLQAYPDLATYFNDKTRRYSRSKTGNETKDHLDYDIEYGMLYY